MTSLVIVLCINSETDRRGRPHSTVEAKIEDPNHDVRIIAVGFVHGPHGTIGADLAIKVTPKVGLHPAQHRLMGKAEPPHPKPRRKWHATTRVPSDDN